LQAFRDRAHFCSPSASIAVHQ